MWRLELKFWRRFHGLVMKRSALILNMNHGSITVLQGDKKLKSDGWEVKGDC